MVRRLLIVFGFLFILGACGDSRPEMRERFDDGRMVIMTDLAGRRYAVKHHVGDIYFIYPIKTEKEGAR
jgi:hypothetical protein